MTFQELVASFNQQQTTWEELCLEIRCESCFASVFDEVTEQMGSASHALVLLADEFPNHFKSYAKERGLDQPWWILSWSFVWRRRCSPAGIAESIALSLKTSLLIDVDNNSLLWILRVELNLLKRFSGFDANEAKWSFSITFGLKSPCNWKIRLKCLYPPLEL